MLCSGASNCTNVSLLLEISGGGPGFRPGSRTWLHTDWRAAPGCGCSILGRICSSKYVLRTSSVIARCGRPRYSTNEVQGRIDWVSNKQTYRVLVPQESEVKSEVV